MKDIEKTKEMVDQEVFDKVDRGTELFHRIHYLRERMERCEAVGKQLKKDDYYVEIKDVSGRVMYIFSSGDKKEPPPVGKIMEQILDVLEAMYFAEMNAVRKEFNNLLKTDEDG